jgi:hypothetical protein
LPFEIFFSLFCCNVRISCKVTRTSFNNLPTPVNLPMHIQFLFFFISIRLRLLYVIPGGRRHSFCSVYFMNILYYCKRLYLSNNVIFKAWFYDTCNVLAPTTRLFPVNIKCFSISHPKAFSEAFKVICVSHTVL